MKKSILTITLIGIAFAANSQEKIVTGNSGKSDFTYTNGNISIGDSFSGSVVNVLKKPAKNEAHLFLGNPYSETQSGVVSSRLSFAGIGIQHAGLAWVPNNANSRGDGKLHLSFGNYQNPMKNPIKVTFRSNGFVGIGTTDPKEKLNIINGNISISNSNDRGSSAFKIFRGRLGADAATISFGEDSKQNWFFGHLYNGGSITPSLYISQKSAIRDGNGKLIHTPEFTLLSNGNIGIGTTNPEANLQIGGSTVDGLIMLGGGKGYSSIGSTRSDGGLVLGKNVYSRYLDASDNLIARVGKTSNSGLAGIKIGQNGLIDFFGKKGNVTADNVANSAENIKMRIDTDGNIGIGTTIPKAKLDILAKATSYETFIKLKTSDAPNDELIINNATGVDKQFIPNIVGKHVSDDRSALYLSGWIGEDNDKGNTPIMTFDSRIVGKPATIRPLFGWDSHGQRKMTLTSDGKLGIGTNTTGNHKLAVEGSIGAREIKVEAYPNWSDFVFEKNYELPTLTEVENHIKEKGHLKDIPSAEEVKKDGFFLGEMDAKLLQKIEELTLYTIDQEKKLNTQDSKIEKLKKENEVLKLLLERVTQLEKQVNKK